MTFCSNPPGSAAANVVFLVIQPASREQSKLEVEARKILFVHVRLNRVHCRVTYQVRLPHLPCTAVHVHTCS
jgi:hypothetical protein